MVYSLIPATLLTLAGVSLSVRSRRRFADTLAPVMLCTMLILFLSYVGGCLRLGWWAVCGLSLLSTLLILPGKYRQEVKDVLRAPSFRWYLLGVGVVFLFALGKYVILWDSLRLWGAVPKALHTFATLQLGDAAAIYPNMQSYPPGMHLLCWFFASFSPVFPEGSLYFTYSFFGIALMLPLLGRLDGESKRMQVIAFLLILFLPRFITCMNEDEGFYYASLYIDIPLGILCGYCFSRAFRFARGDGFDGFCLVVSCAALALLKDSGAAFALWSIAAMVAQTLLNRKHCCVRKKLFTTAIAAVVLVATWAIWRGMLTRYGVINHLTLHPEIPGIMTLARLFFYFLRTPVTGIFTVTGGVHLSLPAALVTLLGLKLLLSRHNETASFREEIANVAIEFLCYAVFFLGWFLTFPEEIASQYYPSYVRYFCTLVICGSYILASDCLTLHFAYLKTFCGEIRSFVTGSSTAGAFLRSFGRVVCWAFVIAFLFTAGLVIFDFPGQGEPIHARAKAAEAALTETLKEGDIYMVNPEDSGVNAKVHHFLYYALIDDGIRIRNFYDTQDILDLAYTKEAFLEELNRYGCGYVYLPVMTQSLLETYGDFFPDCEGGETDVVFRLEGTALTRIR